MKNFLFDALVQFAVKFMAANTMKKVIFSLLGASFLVTGVLFTKSIIELLLIVCNLIFINYYIKKVL